MTYQTDDVSDFLEHVGVKGMRWGHRKARTPGPSTREIRDARRRMASQKDAISEQVVKTYSPSQSKDLKKNVAKIDKMTAEYLRNPDRLTAARLTRGEKIAIGLVTVGLGPAGVPIGLGAMAGQTVRRKAIEKSVDKYSKAK